MPEIFIRHSSKILVFFSKDFAELMKRICVALSGFCFTRMHEMYEMVRIDGLSGKSRIFTRNLPFAKRR